MKHFAQLVEYLERMTELEAQLPADERAELRAWYGSPDFTRDSDWPGWPKYLGPRPRRQKFEVVPLRRLA